MENKNIVKGRGYDELKFLMGSDGSIVFFGSGGNHRFSICRLLKVKKVKGFLIGIHEDNLKEQIPRDVPTTIILINSKR